MPQHCQLQHPFFAKLGGIVFRPGDGEGVPVLAMTLGSTMAALPLLSLQRELGIKDTSTDGRMLVLIARALEFVNDLRPGDALPAEVLGGAASWQPDRMHLQLAVSRIKLQLANWLADGTGLGWQDAGDDMILAMVDDPAMRQRIQEAFAEVGRKLGLPSVEAVVELVEDVARELAFIEALRARLLHRVDALSIRLGPLARALRVDAVRLEVMARVQKLTDSAVAQFRSRFEDLDAQTSEVLAVLGNFENQRNFIRTHRDRLYCSLRAWEPLLAEWDHARTDLDEKLWPLVIRTYRFLAPRYMPMQEWRNMSQATVKNAPQSKQLVW